MIIIKTNNGDVFVNEKTTHIVEHNREDKTVVIRNPQYKLNSTINDVEGVIYANDAQPTSWKDEGSEIQRLKATIEKKDKEYDQMMEHSRFMREWFMIYQDAFYDIKAIEAKQKENKFIHASSVEIINRAEKKYQESQERFKEVRAKWDK